MKKNTTRNYKEVKLDSNGREGGRYYRNPLARTFRYEYALYRTVADLFGSVRCRSMCVDSLRLYFIELGHRQATAETAEAACDGLAPGGQVDPGKKDKVTQESLLEEMGLLVARDVIGHVTFPMMHICAADVKTIAEADGTHSFVFTDDIYGFRLHLDMQGKSKPKKIVVEDLGQKTPDHEVHVTERGHAALKSAA